MNEKLKRLYLNARKHFDLPDFEQFSVDMQDPNKMAKLRENMILHYDMPSLDQMYQDFGVKKKDIPVATGSALGSGSSDSQEITEDRIKGIKSYFDRADITKEELSEDKNIQAAINSGVITKQDLIDAGYEDPDKVDVFGAPNKQRQQAAKEKISALRQKTDDEIDLAINQKKLNVPYAYEDSSTEDSFVNDVYNSSKLALMNINPKDFDGFLEERGLKKDFLDKQERGLYDRTYGSSQDAKLAYELEKSRMLNLYISEQLNRDIEQQKLTYQKETGIDPDYLDENFQASSSNVRIDMLSGYSEKEMPYLTKKLKEVEAKNRALYEDYKDGGIGVGTFMGTTIEEGWSGFTNRINQLSASFYGLVGEGAEKLGVDYLSNVADAIRMQMDQEKLLDVDNLSYAYVSGKRVNVGGTNYLVDDSGQIYDLDSKIRVTQFLDANTTKIIKDEANTNGVEDSSFSGRGTTFQTANVVGDMVVQIALTGGTASTASAAGAITKQLGILGRTKGALKSLPLSRGMSSAIIAQTTMGASSGYEQTLQMAKDAGLSDNEARELAQIGSIEMALLYAITAPISPQTKATEALFGKIKNETIEKAIEGYKNLGKEGFRNTFANAAKEAVDLIGEGIKESIQENVQQAGETLIVNRSLNEEAGREIASDTITADEFINTTILSLTAGMIMPGAGSSLNALNRKARDIMGMGGIDRLKSLDYIVRNEDKVKSLLADQVNKGVYVQSKVDELLSEIETYKNSVGKIPNKLKPEVALEIMEDIEKIRNLETEKKTKDPAFHDAINKEINDIRNNIKSKTDAVQEQEADVVSETEQAETVQEVEAEVQEEAKVEDAINRPVTLTKLGGTELETPIQGDLFVEGQQLVVEDSEGNITEVGNVNELSGQNISDAGIEFEVSEVTVNQQGNIEIGGTEYTIQEDLPTQGIEYNEDGTIKSVSIKKGDKPVEFRGQTATDVGYQILLKQAQSPEQEQTINELLEQDEEFQNELRQVETTTETEADQDTEQTVEPTEETSLDKLRNAFDQKQVGGRTINKVEQKIEIESLAEKARRALSKILPDVKINVYYNESDYYNAIGVKDNSNGTFNPNTNTISINLTRASKATVAHEVFHAVLANKLKTDANIRKVTKQMIEAMIRTQDPRLLKALSDEVKELGYDTDVQNEEMMSELFGTLAGEYKKLKPASQNVIKKFLNRLAKLLGLRRFTDTEIVDVLNVLAGKVSKGEVISDEDIAAITEGASTFLDGPTTINTKSSKFQVKAPVEPGALSFVTQNDLIDIDSLVKDIASKGEKVWFWVADQLGRGMYMDTQVGKEHYLDAGPSYALDPENRSKGIVWATGKTENQVKPLIEQADYIFIMSGSPLKSKLFNKRIINILKDRVGDYNTFKQGVLNSKPIKAIKDVLESHDSWESITESPDRKKLLNAIEGVKSVKSTPLKVFLENNNAFIDINSLRDSFYSDNDFKMNDIMLVLKPTGFGGKSKHSTYENDILGEVVGVPNKKVNAYDLMPAEVKQKYSDVMTETQKSQVVAPYGSGLKGVRKQKGKRPSLQSIYEKAEELGISKKEARSYARELGYTQQELTDFVVKKEQIYVKGNNFVLNALDNMRRYLFSAKSFMPKNAFIAKETMSGMVQSEIKAAERNAKKLNKLMRNQPDEMHDKVEAFLRGEKVELPENIAMLVKEMRLHIDSLSRQLVDSGAIKTSESKENILANVGSYLNRSYRLFNDKNYVDNLSEEVINEAKEFLKKQIEKNLKSEAKNKEVSLESLIKSKDGGEDFTTEEYIDTLAQQQVNDIIKKSEANSFVISATEGVKKDVTILKERKEIPAEIRALMGEYTDPAFNYVMSVAKIKSLVETQKYLEKLRDIGEGVFLFKENDVRRPSNYKRISAAKKGKAVYSPAFSPLDGLYGPPEMVDQMQKKTGPLNFNSPILQAIYKGWIKGVGAVKFTKTILSLGTHAKNVLGNLYFMAQNGYVNPKDYNNAFKVLKNNTDEELSKKLEEYIKLGFLNQNVSLNEVKSLLEGDESFDVRISKRMLDKGESRAKKIAKDISKKTNKFLQFSQDLYQAEDDLFKIVAYENEKMDYARILFNKDLDKLNDREKKAVDDKVSEIVKNILPNYSRVGGLGKGLRAFPVAGTFISFQLEAYRTAWNTIHLAKTEMKSNNPREREKGVKRLFAIIATQGIKYGMMALATSGLLDDEEEEKVGVMDVRPMLPRWAKNADIIVTQAGDGKFRYINVSASDPFGGIARAFNALMREEDPINGLIEMTREIADPVINPDILTGAFAQLTQNRNQYGNPIWGSTDSAEEKLLKAAIHIGKVFEPGTLTSIRKIYNADEKIYETIGQFTGYKPHEVDVNKQLHFRLQDIKADADEVNKILSREKYNVRDTGDPSGIYDAIEQVDEKMAPIYENANELVNSAIKVGVPIYEINSNIKSKRFKKKDRLNILFYDRLK